MPKEPVSTYTNIAYGLGAIPVYFYDIPVSIALVLLMFASGGYHWTKSRLWRKLDVMSIFLLFGAMIAHFTSPWMILFAIPFMIWERPIELDYALTGWGAALIVFMYLNKPWEIASVIILTYIAALILQFSSRIENSKYYRDFIHGMWHIVAAAALTLTIIL